MVPDTAEQSEQVDKNDQQGSMKATVAFGAAMSACAVLIGVAVIFNGTFALVTGGIGAVVGVATLVFGATHPAPSGPSVTQKAWAFTIAVALGVGAAVVAEEQVQDNPTVPVSLAWQAQRLDPGAATSAQVAVPDHLTKLELTVHLSDTNSAAGFCRSTVRIDGAASGPTQNLSDGATTTLGIDPDAGPVHLTATLSADPGCTMSFSTSDARFHN